MIKINAQQFDNIALLCTKSILKVKKQESTMNNINNLLVIIYDGIANSVFQSQVLAPLKERLDHDQNLQATLISFERSLPRHLSFTTHSRLTLIIARRFRFFGTLSLWPSILQLQKLIKKIQPDEVLARGPLAGYVALKSFKTTPLTIQARGLCAEEYRFTHNKPSILNALHNYMYKKLDSLERNVYRNKQDNLTLEAVSPALKEYLIDHFDSQPEIITIASRDIPKKYDSKTIQAWRKEIRSQLNIDNNKHVYCYSGSAKPWQCIDEMIEFFAIEYQKNNNAFLLILSQDEQKFHNALLKTDIPKDSYKIVNVKQEELSKYLAAADSGLLFRKKDVINWVARPTKMLEYQSVELPIIHNDTVEFLIK